MRRFELSEDDIEFTYQYTLYTKDTKLLDMLNKAFGGNAIAAWSSERVNKTKGAINFGAGSIIVLLPNHTITHIESSEWANIKYGDKI